MRFDFRTGFRLHAAIVATLFACLMHGELALAAPLDPVATVLFDEHTDLAASLAGGLNLFVSGDESGDFLPHQALLFVDRPARGNRPAGSNFDFIGVEAGQKYWRLPQSQNTKLLYLGTNANGVDFDAIGSYVETDPRVTSKIAAPWIKYTIAGVHGRESDQPAPGDFSVWTSGDAAPTVWVSTASGGITAVDALLGLAQSHLHFNWGFTARGIYGVDIAASAYLGPGKTNPIASQVVTFYFGVEAGLPGDATLDSLVDGADYTLWADHYLRTNDATWREGDFNLDYIVDGADYTIWADNYRTSLESTLAVAVPEPATSTLAVIGGVIVFWGVRRGRRRRCEEEAKTRPHRGRLQPDA
jgi:surface-anchored protein